MKFDNAVDFSAEVGKVEVGKGVAAVEPSQSDEQIVATVRPAPIREACPGLDSAALRMRITPPPNQPAGQARLAPTITGGLIRAYTFDNNEPVRLDLERQATPQ
jgi:hypothetical protein